MDESCSERQLPFAAGLPSGPNVTRELSCPVRQLLETEPGSDLVEASTPGAERLGENAVRALSVVLEREREARETARDRKLRRKLLGDVSPSLPLLLSRKEEGRSISLAWITTCIAARTCRSEEE